MFDKESSLQIVDLNCSRGDRDLFVGLNFGLNAGELLQVEGRNGCGKTSLLRIISGLMPAESGEVLWNGQDKEDLVDELAGDFYQSLISLGHHAGIKSELTALENLEFSRQLRNTNSNCRYDALERLSLRGFEDIPCQQLSAGQKRRVALASLLLSDCQLWILDEPFTSLDPKGVAIVEAMCQEHLDKGGMILLTSHQPLQSLAQYQQSLNVSQFAVE